MPALADVRPELASLDPVLAAALAKNPDDRFACCTDFARAFTETAAPQTLRVAAAPTTPAPAARRPDVTPSPSKTDGATAQGDSASSVTRWLIGVSVAAVLLLLGVIGVPWRPWQHPQSNTTAISSSNAPTTSTPTPTATAAAPPPAPTSAAPEPPAPTDDASDPEAHNDLGPRLGEECADRMKFSTDAVTGEEMICDGYSEDIGVYGKLPTWLAVSQWWGDKDRLPVGALGSPCNVPEFTSGRSSDGYAVWCLTPSFATHPEWVLATP